MEQIAPTSVLAANRVQIVDYVRLVGADFLDIGHFDSLSQNRDHYLRFACRLFNDLLFIDPFQS